MCHVDYNNSKKKIAAINVFTSVFHFPTEQHSEAKLGHQTQLGEVV